MKKLLDSIESLKKSNIKEIVDQRIKEFSKIKQTNADAVFKELCFCIMTANCGAEKCIEIHEGVGNGFLKLNQEELAEKFKDLGYRFPNVRSKYIMENLANREELWENIIDHLQGHELRDWIVKNFKGIGYKEASHFLRNIGFEDYAIIDFHIVDLLVKYGLIEKPKTMTKAKYLEIEKHLKEMGKKLGLNMAELDLYLWYMETGKILK